MLMKVWLMSNVVRGSARPMSPMLAFLDLSFIVLSRQHCKMLKILFENCVPTRSPRPTAHAFDMNKVTNSNFA